jgi:hypothetical protein
LPRDNSTRLISLLIALLFVAIGLYAVWHPWSKEWVKHAAVLTGALLMAPGMLLQFLIEGVHGKPNETVITIGRAVNFLINAVAYYALIQWVIRKRAVRKISTLQSGQ